MLRFKTYVRYLEERMKGGMPPGEWAKPNSNTKIPRIDILRLLMKSGEAMPKVDGTEIIVKNTSQNIAAVDKLEKEQKTQELETDKGFIKSNEIKKSIVFGGDQGGRGGGDAQTARAEIMQCVYCEHMVNNTRASFESIQPSDLEKAYNATSVVGATFEQVMELDPSWHYSGYWTAKRLVKDKLINNKMTFHRNDKVMKDIYKVKDVTVKNPASFFVPLLMFNTNVLEASRINNVKKLVYTSSIGAYSSSEIFKHLFHSNSNIIENYIEDLLRYTNAN